jgi:hypothetical protein
LILQDIAKAKAELGWTLRSGANQGADTAFEMGAAIAKGRREIFVPWYGFRGITERNKVAYITRNLPNHGEAMRIARTVHPHWEDCSPSDRLMLTRGVYEVLGTSLNKQAHRVLIWTYRGQYNKDLLEVMRLARIRDIPVHNLGEEKTMKAYLKFLKEFQVRELEAAV